MGLLLNSRYWAAVSMAMWQAKPEGNWSDITAEQRDYIRKLGCRVFSELSSDPELENDVRKIENVIEQNPVNLEGKENFDFFFEQFIIAEGYLVENAGRHLGITREILQDLRRLKEDIQNNQYWDNRILSQINALKERVCGEVKAAQPQEPSPEQRAWDGCKAMLIISVNASLTIGATVGAAVVTAGVAAAAGFGTVGFLSSFSITSGQRKLVADALRNAW